jgi:hypothetical protein
MNIKLRKLLKKYQNFAQVINQDLEDEAVKHHHI